MKRINQKQIAANLYWPSQMYQVYVRHCNPTDSLGGLSPPYFIDEENRHIGYLKPQDAYISALFTKLKFPRDWSGN